MIPATSYSQFAFDTAYRYGYNVSPADPRQAEYVIRAEKKASGDFTFTNVPAGDWYAFSRIEWDQAGQHMFRNRGKKVTVRNGESVQVDLSLPKGAGEGQNATFQ